jgi:glycosyltransferase involved in cell wall biosynthesis
MNMTPSITVVLPAYNEVQVIGNVVQRTASALRRHAASGSEIVVVDDGSTDGTAAAAGKASLDGIPVRVISHPVNRGYGAALRTGFAAANAEAIWIMDSDGQFDPEDLKLLLPLYSRDTVVAGYRISRQDPLMRRLSNRAFFSIVRAVFGRTVRDVNCAFKLLPRAAAAGLRSEGAMISTELMERARRRGYKIAEVGVPHHPRTTGRATGANRHVVARAFWELWRMWRDRASWADTSEGSSQSTKSERADPDDR